MSVTVDSIRRAVESLPRPVGKKLVVRSKVAKKEAYVIKDMNGYIECVHLPSHAYDRLKAEIGDSVTSLGPSAFEYTVYDDER